MIILRSQKGFTLIEALIAFVVMTVGILGALLFHATLLSESTDNKSRLEAIQLAERYIESNRASYVSKLQYDALISSVTSESSGSGETVTGKLNTYNISVTAPEAVVSGSDTAYKFTVDVEWPSGSPTDSVSLVSFLGFVDPQYVMEPDDAGGGTGGDYEGKIPLPTGTMTALDRLEIEELEIGGGDIADAVEVDSRGAVSIYKDTEDGEDVLRVVIEVDDKFIQIGTFDSEDNEFLLISGRIYNNRDHPLEGVKAGSTTKVKFGYVQGRECSSATASEVKTDAGFCFEKDIIDLSTTGGANCIIGRYENNGDVGLWADYLCVAGTGWNGAIEPYARTYEDNIKKTDLESGGAEVCSPKLRSYRYYLLETDSEDELSKLLAYRDFSDWGSTSPLKNNIQDILSYSGASLAGQSGLVRFTASDTSIGEQVPWDSYFWVNPNYIVSPGQQSGSLWLTPSFAGPSTYVEAGGTAAAGYGSPLVTSTAGLSYQTMLPGDIAHQNFYLSDGNFDCSTLNFTDFDFADSKENYSEASSLAEDSFLQPYHLASGGYPGGIVANSGYRPVTSGATIAPPNNLVTGGWFDEDDYNAAVGDTGTGVIVLGYALTTDRITGTVTFASAAGVSADNITIGGASSTLPTVTQCYAVANSEEVSGSNVTYEYYCAVPEWWKGEIFAYISSGASAVSSHKSCRLSEPPGAVAEAPTDWLSYVENSYTSKFGLNLSSTLGWSYYSSVVSNPVSGGVGSYVLNQPYAAVASEAADSLAEFDFRFVQVSESCP